jgi:hypothetical protein
VNPSSWISEREGRRDPSYQKVSRDPSSQKVRREKGSQFLEREERRLAAVPCC